jgi:hypothetical protein
LLRKEKLHIPSVYRLFHRNLPDSRCIRTNVVLNNREYLGLTRELQGHYHSDFHFIVLGNPIIGSKPVSEEDSLMKTTITQINKLRPKFCVVIGNFTSSMITLEKKEKEKDNTDSTNNSSVVVNSTYSEQIQSFRRFMARISDTIPVIFVPGDHEMSSSSSLSREILSNYYSLFGCDYFGFWYQGTRGLVLNSVLMIQGERDYPEEFHKQEEWLDEEIEQAKLCSNNIILFMYHPWFYFHPDEEDIDITMTTAPYYRIR